MKKSLLTAFFFAAYTLFLEGQTITTGNIASPICVGSLIAVPLTITGTFNFGNIFIVELSDANGSFSSPDTIGRLNSSTNCVISSSLPYNLPGGNGYLVRVVSTSPSVISSNSNAIIINPLPEITIDSIVGPLCENQSIMTIAVNSLPPVNSTFNIDYSLSGSNTYTDTANINFISGHGTFTIPITPHSGSDTLNITYVFSQNTGCSSVPLRKLYNVLSYTPLSPGEGNETLFQASNGLMYAMSASLWGAVIQFNPNTNAIDTLFVGTPHFGGGYDFSGGPFMQASNGLLYGSGVGFLIQLNINTNTFDTLFYFTGMAGNYPGNNLGGFIQATNGMLYGLTEEGGTYNGGVLFQFNPNSNAYNALLSFSGASGDNPYGNLIQANNGLLYGMTWGGGSYGDGVLFQFNPNSNTYDTVFSFSGTSGNHLGNNPLGSLIQANDGLLYGLTPTGGTYGDGVLFQFNPNSNTYNALFSFNGALGSHPDASLLQANNGLLYGCTSAGGSYGYGVLFQFNINSNTFDTLFSFTGTFGNYPGQSLGNLIQASNGLLYGLVGTGGDYANVFQVNLNNSYTLPLFTENLYVPPLVNVSIEALDSACNGLSAILKVNYTPDTIPATYHWNNGSTTDVITTAQSGNYAVTITTYEGCTASSNIVPLPTIANCGGRLVLQSDSIINYFDTLHVNVFMENANNIFGIYAKLNFDNSKLQLVSSTVGNVLGNNPNYQAPIVTGGSIDFGMDASGPCSNDSGLVYSFEFTLTNLPNIPFNATDPDSIATRLTLTSPTVNDCTGALRDVGMPGPDTVCLRYYVPVWPGDLNNDGAVNGLDIFPIGLFYNKTGPARPNASLTWIAQPAELWGFDKTNPNNNAYETFADGNGDGLIDLADRTAIFFDAGNVHALPPMVSSASSIARSSSPPLSAFSSVTRIDSTQLPYILTDSINLGSPSQPIDSVFGVAFDLYFDAECVDTSLLGDSSVTYSSLFGTYGTQCGNIALFKRKGEGVLSFGITRLLGNGPIRAQGDNILTVQFKLISGCYGGWFHVRPSVLGCDSADGAANPLVGSPDSVQIIAPAPPTAVVQMPVTSTIKLYPNPTKNYVTIGNIDFSLHYSIAIVNSVGKAVYQAPLTQNIVDLSRLAAGVYSVVIRNDAEVVTQKLVVTR